MDWIAILLLIGGFGAYYLYAHLATRNTPDEWYKERGEAANGAGQRHHFFKLYDESPEEKEKLRKEMKRHFENSTPRDKDFDFNKTIEENKLRMDEIKKLF